MGAGRLVWWLTVGVAAAGGGAALWRLWVFVVCWGGSGPRRRWLL